jgi:hypothetical protein
MPDISLQYLRKILRYNPETGDFIGANPFDRRTFGRRVGFQSRRTGRSDEPVYWIIQIGVVRYRAHRLAWFYMTGEWPKILIDHKDCDGLNNRWGNLREADYSANNQNSRCRSDNQAGLKGVDYHKRARKWRASICLRGQRTYLGLFETAEDAHAAYVAAATRLFGEFARAA